MVYCAIVSSTLALSTMYVAKYTDVRRTEKLVTRTTYAQLHIKIFSNFVILDFQTIDDGTVSIDAKIQVNIAHFFYREMLFNRRRW